MSSLSSDRSSETLLFNLNIKKKSHEKNVFILFVYVFFCLYMHGRLAIIKQNRLQI